MEYHEEFRIEQQYLDKTCEFIQQTLRRELQTISDEKGQIIDARKDMWENISFIGGFNNAAEANQLLEAIQTRAASYDATHVRADRLKAALDSPYFARVDFLEQGWEGEPEKIYIGLSTLMDDDTYETYVYDWRAPISSIFYRYELGQVEYQAPSGVIQGEVSLKRQYEIKNSTLNYFFDSSVNIVDEMLRAALSQNASPTMKNIVETIQRQQDMIIRDTQNELVIVQGVAGSGKTSVALHRVAFLLYEGVSEKLSANNILIISPNNLFGSYIANVLPELGEENISSLTFEALFYRAMKHSLTLSSRNDLLEAMLAGKKKKDREFLHQMVEFKSSQTFCTILERYVGYFTHKMIPFTDIYYNGKVIETREEMHSFLLSSNRQVPAEKALELIAQRIWIKIHKICREERLPQLQSFAGTFKEHLYDAKQFGRLLSIKESVRLKRQIQKFTTVDCVQLYRNLFQDMGLFRKLAKGLELPDKIGEIIGMSCQALEKNTSRFPYEDALPLLYLNIRLSGCGLFSGIRQVVVDEAQDYYPIHFQVLKHLFPYARYTVMGDINQTIEKDASPSVYEEIKQILQKKTSCTITLNKGFRCSTEINEFSRKFLEDDSGFESFERHEAPPQVINCNDESEMVQEILSAVQQFQQAGLQSIGVLCKSREDARKVYGWIQGKLPVALLDTNRRELFSGVMLMPVYMAKGLEFDGAVVCGVDDSAYRTPYDRKLLYVACTRALHRLAVLYTGKPSRFLDRKKIMDKIKKAPPFVNR